MKIERKAMDKEKRFDFLLMGEIFLDVHSNVYIKTEEITSYNEDGTEEFEANAVNLSNGRVEWFNSNEMVVIPLSHNLLIEY